jgi:hypothetical protein
MLCCITNEDCHGLCKTWAASGYGISHAATSGVLASFSLNGREDIIHDSNRYVQTGRHVQTY